MFWAFLVLFYFKTLSQVTKQTEILFHVLDKRGVKEEGTGNDVSQGIYSSFWIDATESYFIGEKQRDFHL